MKASPIQLLESSIQKVFVESNDEYDEESNGTGPFEEIVLQTFKRVDAFPDYWDDEKPPVDGLADRTYRLSLGVRTPTDDPSTGPYMFEVVFNAVVACVPERVGTLTAAQAAREYGLTMVYGMIREQLLNATSRMPYGARLLPSVSFIGDSDAEPDPAAAPVAPAASEEAAKNH